MVLTPGSPLTSSGPLTAETENCIIGQKFYEGQWFRPTPLEFLLTTSEMLPSPESVHLAVLRAELSCAPWSCGLAESTPSSLLRASWV